MANMWLEWGADAAVSIVSRLSRTCVTQLINRETKTSREWIGLPAGVLSAWVVQPISDQEEQAGGQHKLIFGVDCYYEYNSKKVRYSQQPTTITKKKYIK